MLGGLPPQPSCLAFGKAKSNDDGKANGKCVTASRFSYALSSFASSDAKRCQNPAIFTGEMKSFLRPIQGRLGTRIIIAHTSEEGDDLGESHQGPIW